MMHLLMYDFLLIPHTGSKSRGQSFTVRHLHVAIRLSGSNTHTPEVHRVFSQTPGDKRIFSLKLIYTMASHPQMKLLTSNAFPRLMISQTRRIIRHLLRFDVISAQGLRKIKFKKRKKERKKGKEKPGNLAMSPS